MSTRRVTLAVVIGAHGVTGEVRLKLFTDSFDSFRAFKIFEASGRTLTLKAAKDTPKGVIARFAEVPDRNAAEALRGSELTVDRDALPPPGEGEVYIADLIGLAVVTTDGAAVGTVFAVENYGAGDILEIEQPDGKRFMVPFNADAVPEASARIVLDPAFLP
ncbi:ribosome maturation factor RimM [Sphingosinicella microcystinivorans]|uniref:ribosome maturation factor RimM n=1 Tax=Sphingosinicella microcystinivorans TaxID=335406 RepID=UPI0022F38AE2|nr:ribosome maturation factor RimM [Sphingosinicella microcystinivorans]WBX85047.1 ribosome maturation factor RimM [Sphingosinicella microcystinivorans]